MLWFEPTGHCADLINSLHLRAGSALTLNRFAVVKVSAAKEGCANYISHTTHATLNWHDSSDAVILQVVHKNGVKVNGTVLRVGEKMAVSLGDQLRLPSRVDGKDGWMFQYILRRHAAAPSPKRVRTEEGFSPSSEPEYRSANCRVDEEMDPEIMSAVTSSASIQPLQQHASKSPRSPRARMACSRANPIADGKENSQEELEKETCASQAAQIRAANASAAAFDGRDLYLNMLEDQTHANERSACHMPEVSKAQLLAPVDRLVRAMFTSYGVDYALVAQLVSGSPASCIARGVTVVDNYEHHFCRPGLDEHTYAVGDPDLGAKISVVMPSFFEDDASAAERARVRFGSMHAKMWLLCFDGGGMGGGGFLRLVISSANLGTYDANINNQIWACDFPLLRSPSQLGNQPAATSLSCAEFGADLRRFVGALLERAAPEINQIWQQALDQYELIPPPGTHLIISVPGRWSVSKRTPPVPHEPDGRPAELRVAEAELYGQLALKRHLRKGLQGRADAQRPSRIEYAISSLGRLEDILEPLLGRLAGDGKGSVLRPDQKVTAPRSFLEGSTRQPSGKLAEAWVVWPCLCDVLPALSRFTQVMSGPGDLACMQLKHCIARNLMSNRARQATLHHFKLAAGVVSEEMTVEDDADPEQEWQRSAGHAAQSEQNNPLCAWLYAGSHNLSGAAWGKMELTEDEEGDEEVIELVCMSYEIGVLLIPPEPRRFPLPWVSPATAYDPEWVRPFAWSRYMDILRGKSALAKDDVETCASKAAKLWRWLQSDPSRVLPRALKLPLDYVRRLMKVEVTLRDCVVPFAHPPVPGSEYRRRSRHLRDGTGGGTDELLKRQRCSSALLEGLQLEAVRVGDFSYGPGHVKGLGDPIIRVYELISGGFIDDYDRNLRPTTEQRIVSIRSPSVRVVDRDGPRAVVLAFLAVDDDPEANAPLMHALADASEDIDRICWGVIFLQPDERASFTAPLWDPPWTPSHSDLLCLECKLEPSRDLPAIVLRTTDLNDELFVCKGKDDLMNLRQTAELQHKLRTLELEMGGAALEPATAVGVCSANTNLKMMQVPRSHTSCYKLERAEAGYRAAQAADWVRQQRFRLILMEPDGILKKQCCTNVHPSAAVAVSMRRRSIFGALKYDAFRPDCVRFLRALLLDHGGRDDMYDPLSMYGDGPTPNSGKFRSDAPPIALVTNFGHLVSKSRPGETSLLTEDQVRSTLDNLIARVASELGVSVQALCGQGGDSKQFICGPFISFRAHGATLQGVPDALTPTASVTSPAPLDCRRSSNPSNERCGPPTQDISCFRDKIDVVDSVESRVEWSAEWSKPRPGMLRAAMEKSGIDDPRSVLMIGFDYVDSEAAFQAGVNYMPYQHLIQCIPNSTSYWHCFNPESCWDHFVPAAEAKAVQAVAPQRFAAPRSKGRDDAHQDR